MPEQLDGKLMGSEAHLENLKPLHRLPQIVLQKIATKKNKKTKKPYYKFIWCPSPKCSKVNGKDAGRLQLPKQEGSGQELGAQDKGNCPETPMWGRWGGSFKCSDLMAKGQQPTEVASRWHLAHWALKGSLLCSYTPGFLTWTHWGMCNTLGMSCFS